MNYKTFSTIFPIPEDIFKQLEQFQDLLNIWNKAYNLVQKDSLKEFWTRHVLDSLELYLYLKLWQETYKETLLYDLGSGGGFPGIILAIVGIKNIVLVEARQKKCAFLREVCRVLRLEIPIYCMRFEEMVFESSTFICRALAPFQDLLKLSNLPKVSHETFHLWGIKGIGIEKEIEDGKKIGIDRPYKVHLGQFREGNRIIEILPTVR